MKNEETDPTKKKVVPYDVPVEGSLGLLALGAAGIKAWREKRDELKKQQAKKEKNE